MCLESLWEGFKARPCDWQLRSLSDRMLKRHEALLLLRMWSLRLCGVDRGGAALLWTLVDV